MVNAVLDDHHHPTLEMIVNVTMQQPSAGAGYMVSCNHPRHVTKGGKRRKPVPSWWIDQVKLFWYISDSFIGRVPSEMAHSGSNLEHLISMLVNGMRRHRLVACKEHKVDPSIELGVDSYVVLWIESWCEKGWLQLINIGRHQPRAIHRPEIGSTINLHVEREKVVGFCGNGFGWVWMRDGLIEKCNLWGKRISSYVDGGIGVVSAVVTPNRQYRVAHEYLGYTDRAAADFEVSGLFRVDEHRIPISIRHCECLNELRLNVGAVHCVYPHVVLVNGDDRGYEVEATDDVYSDPLTMWINGFSHLERFD